MISWSVGHPERERLEVVLLSVEPEEHAYRWAQARATVMAGGFQGEAALSLLVSEMEDFKNSLEPVYRDLKGVAEFKTLEDQLYLKVEIDHVGHVNISGYLKDDASFGNKFSFALKLDQTLLWHTISELDEALFNIKQKSG